MASTASLPLDTLLAEIDQYGTRWNTDRLREAYAVAQEAYGDYTHWTGESLMEYSLSVLQVVLPFQPDEDTIIACLLHQVLQVPDWTLIDLEQLFGPRVRSLVSGVHLLSHVTIRGRRVSVQDLRVMLLTVSEDIRTVLVSLCERCYLLQYAWRLPQEDQRALAQDALQLFAPVAARLGIYSLKHELENRAFPLLYPNDAERIGEQAVRLRHQYGDFLPKAADVLREHLQAAGVEAEVFSREKQLYSIFLKMRHKSITGIEDIYDLYALRVVVPTVEDCYRALGIIHQLGRPMGHRFKDYISFPKPNGYQSLHTTVLGLERCPENMFVEVQVRTADMHRKAQYGVAAHWSYKEHGSTERAMQQAQLHQMLVAQETRVEAGEAVLVDHIYVLTPKGDVMELPEGATPLDFAFQVHTDLGIAFKSARVNGAIVPIDYELENGDVVEITKQNTPHPSPQWFNLLRLSSARSKLKRYLYAQNKPELVTEGRRLVNDQLKARGLSLLDQELSLLRLVDGEKLSLQEREELLMKIGQGAERASSLLERIDADTGTTPQQLPKKKPIPSATSEIDVQLEGNVPMPTRFALCCKPHERAHGALTGVVNRSGQVVIHRADCGMLHNANPERQMRAVWARKTAKKAREQVTRARHPAPKQK